MIMSGSLTCCVFVLGAEAMFADLGHFNYAAIQASFYFGLNAFTQCSKNRSRRCLDVCLVDIFFKKSV